MSSIIHTVAKQFALHTRLFNNVLEGIADEKGSERLSDEINHLQWIAGHLVYLRYSFGSSLGINANFEYTDLYCDTSKPPPNNMPLDPSVQYPPLGELKKLWNDQAPIFVAALDKIPEDNLTADLPFGTPIGDKSLLSFLSFLASHEAYHIGQMSIIRKYMGLSAMSYK